LTIILSSAGLLRQHVCFLLFLNAVHFSVTVCRAIRPQVIPEGGLGVLEGAQLDVSKQRQPEHPNGG
jgi:hypothetical protein